MISTGLLLIVAVYVACYVSYRTGCAVGHNRLIKQIHETVSTQWLDDLKSDFPILRRYLRTVASAAGIEGYEVDPPSPYYDPQSIVAMAGIEGDWTEDGDADCEGR